MRIVIFKAGEIHRIYIFLNQLGHLAVVFDVAQAQADVLSYSHPGEKAIVLEYENIIRAGPDHFLSVNQDGP